MTDFQLLDNDGDTRVVRVWSDVPDELIQSMLNALGEPDASALVPADVATAAAAALLPRMVLDIHEP